MTIYHTHVQVIGRRGGAGSAVASAAYRAGQKLRDERVQETHDYSRKQGVVHSEVALPAGMPERFRDRSELWNDVERTEASDNARLAREVEFALPVELDLDEHIELCRAAAEHFVGQGMAADWSIHDTGRGNPHCHMMLTMRAWDADRDRWMPKTVTRYLVRDNQGGERLATSEEFKQLKTAGWEKVYAYGGQTMTKTEAGEAGLNPTKDRDSSSPVKEIGRTVDWDDQEKVVEWRTAWERLANQALERAQVQERVDCRSYAEQDREQDCERVPTMHMGPQVAAMERREQEACEREGREYEPVTDIGRANAEIRELNAQIEAVRERLAEVARQIREAAARAAQAVRDAAERVQERIQSQTPSEAVREPQTRQPDPEPNKTQNKPLERATEPQELRELRDAVAKLATVPRESQARQEALCEKVERETAPLEAQAKELRAQAEPLAQEAKELRAQAEGMRGIKAVLLKDGLLERAEQLESQAKPLLDQAKELDARVEEAWKEVPSDASLEREQDQLWNRCDDAVRKAVEALPEELMSEVERIIEPVRGVSSDFGYESETIGATYGVVHFLRFEDEEPEYDQEQCYEYEYEHERTRSLWD